MIVWLCDCMCLCLCLCGCVGVCVCGCLVVWVCGCGSGALFKRNTVHDFSHDFLQDPKGEHSKPVELCPKKQSVDQVAIHVMEFNFIQPVMPWHPAKAKPGSAKVLDFRAS